MNYAIRTTVTVGILILGIFFLAGCQEEETSKRQDARTGQTDETQAGQTRVEQPRGEQTGGETEHTGGDTLIKGNIESDFNKHEVADFVLFWKIVDDQLEMVLQAPTDGWVAVGFNPTRMMQDADLLIGFVKDGEPQIRDDFGTWYSSHESDESLGGKQDVTLLDGAESEGITSLSFRVPLDSGDEFDQRIVLGEETTVLLAYGASDNYGSIHRKKVKTTIAF